MTIQEFLIYVKKNKVGHNIKVYLQANKFNATFIEYRRGVIYAEICKDNDCTKLPVGDLIEIFNEEQNKDHDLCLFIDNEYYGCLNDCKVNESVLCITLSFRNIKKPSIIIDDNLPNNEDIRELYLGDLKCLYNKMVAKIA